MLIPGAGDALPAPFCVQKPGSWKEPGISTWGQYLGCSPSSDPPLHSSPGQLGQELAGGGAVDLLTSLRCIGFGSRLEPSDFQRCQGWRLWR